MASEIAWDNVVTVKGDTLNGDVRAWEFLDSDDNVTDLTGRTAKLTVRSSFDEADSVEPILELDSEDSSLAIDTVNGKITLALSASDYADVTPGEYVFDLETTTTSDGTIRTVVRGNWTILGEATRAG